MKSITDYLNEKKVKIIEKASHYEVIDLLLDMVRDSSAISDLNLFKEAIIERENIISTGIGVGIAIPHVRKSFINDFVCSCVVIKKGCDWNSIDNVPVNFAILISSPQDSHREYLRILAQTVLFWKEPENRDLIKKCKTENDVLECLKSIKFEI